MSREPGVVARKRIGAAAADDFQCARASQVAGERYGRAALVRRSAFCRVVAADLVRMLRRSIRLNVCGNRHHGIEVVVRPEPRAIAKCNCCRTFDDLRPDERARERHHAIGRYVRDSRHGGKRNLPCRGVLFKLGENHRVHGGWRSCGDKAAGLPVAGHSPVRIDRTGPNVGLRRTRGLDDVAALSGFHRRRQADNVNGVLQVRERRSGGERSDRKDRRVLFGTCEQDRQLAALTGQFGDCRVLGNDENAAGKSGCTDVCRDRGKRQRAVAALDKTAHVAVRKCRRKCGRARYVDVDRAGRILDLGGNVHERNAGGIRRLASAEGNVARRKTRGICDDHTAGIDIQVADSVQVVRHCASSDFRNVHRLGVGRNADCGGVGLEIGVLAADIKPERLSRRVPVVAADAAASKHLADLELHAVRNVEVHEGTLVHDKRGVCRTLHGRVRRSSAKDNATV